MFTNNFISGWTKSPFMFRLYGLVLLIGISATGVSQEVTDGSSQNAAAYTQEPNYQAASSIYLDQNIIESTIVLNLPDELRHSFTIEIYNLNGFKVLQRKYNNNLSSEIILNISRECQKNGIYIMRYYNNAGISKTLKFRKIMNT